MKGKKRFSGDNALINRDSFNNTRNNNIRNGRLAPVAMPLEVGTVSTKGQRLGRRRRLLSRNALRSRDSFNRGLLLPELVNSVYSRNALRSRDSFNGKYEKGGQRWNF